MHQVGVIGLGAIAAMYGKPEEPAPYCHVGGIRHSKRVRLAAVADIAEPVRERFRERWGAAFPGLAYHNGIAEMLAAHKLDVVAVCVRGPFHCQVMMEVIASPHAPRSIFLEKPPSCSLEEMDRMVAAARERKIAITVSYSRHWAPHVLRLSELVRDGLIGKVQGVIGYAGGGVLSFSSHLTDLICQFGGYDPIAVYARGKIGPSEGLPAGYGPEPEIDTMAIEFASGVRGIHAAAGEHGGLYCDVLGTEGYARAGMYIPPFAKDKTGKAIDLADKMPPNASVFTVAYDQISAWLDGGPLPACTDATWQIINEIGFAAIESIHTGQRIAIPNVSRKRLVHANG
ncbi:MAG: Gfo/Idh/MocA family oxidoreductase [Planctomycetota bacterium]|nr:Gfo/Idh/MocA family oxidoreductase [Planctomycetota bacterium]